MNESTKTLQPPDYLENLKNGAWRAEKKACERYSFFYRCAWDVLEPVTPIIWNWHYDIICDELEHQARRIAARKNKEYDIIINVPPRSGKSTMTTKLYLPWVWTFYPAMRFMAASYDASLALQHAVDSRTIINSLWYKRHWEDVFELTGDQNVKSNYKNDHGGYRISLSVGSSGTGSGGQILMLDDPIDRSAGATYQSVRDEANRWYRQTWYGCLNNKYIDIRIVIMQRIHEDDTTGFLKKYFPGDYKIFCIPAELTDDVQPKELIKYYTGNLFFPSKYSLEILAQDKKALQSDYAGQMLQRPTAPEGNKFKRQWVKFWRPRGSNLPGVPLRINTETVTIESADIPDSFDIVLQSWDMALKPKTENDPCAGGVISKKGPDVFLLNEDHGHYDPFEKEEHFNALKHNYPMISTGLIEDATGGAETIIRLKKKGNSVIGIPPGPREERIENTSALARAGNLWFPHPAIFPGVWDIIDELCVYPRGAHDDRVAYICQAVNYFNIVKKIWPEYDGKKYKFKTKWTAIEKGTYPIITQWIDRDFVSSVLISLWNSNTNILWVAAEIVTRNTIPELMIKTIIYVLKILFPDDEEAWKLERYLYYGNDLMFKKATQNMAASYAANGCAIQSVLYDERGSIIRLAGLFDRKSCIIHDRCVELKEKVMSWTMEKDVKTPEPEISGYGICRSLCLTAAAIWDGGLIKSPKKQDNKYRVKKQNIHGVNDWMKII
jgi:phage terminase large subunit-like protein